MFGFATADLTPGAQDAIATVDDEIGTGTIEGHTDAIGDDASNQSLSERRAEAVRGAFVAPPEADVTGVDVEVGGFGMTEPTPVPA
jgi:OOP family OmpA-OmpF porin